MSWLYWENGKETETTIQGLGFSAVLGLLGALKIIKNKLVPNIIIGHIIGVVYHKR